MNSHAGTLSKAPLNGKHCGSIARVYFDITEMKAIGQNPSVLLPLEMVWEVQDRGLSTTTKIKPHILVMLMVLYAQQFRFFCHLNP